ncbi:MAG: GNAT family N-acetyltransferase [Qingshengfaniella sp.]
MALDIRVLTGAPLRAALDQVAHLRIAVFRDFPYLYDGTLSYERRYLAAYANSAAAILVGAFDGSRLVGAATGTPMADHADDLAKPLEQAGIPLEDTFYCAESVLLPAYRGQGAGHRFFDLRETHARHLGAGWSVFCAVQRPDDHPLKPDGYRPLHDFWAARGYAPLDGCVARFSWTDVGQTAETAKPLQLWARKL